MNRVHDDDEESVGVRVEYTLLAPASLAQAVADHVAVAHDARRPVAPSRCRHDEHGLRLASNRPEGSLSRARARCCSEARPEVGAGSTRSSRSSDRAALALCQSTNQTLTTRCAAMPRPSIARPASSPIPPSAVTDVARKPDRATPRGTRRCRPLAVRSPRADPEQVRRTWMYHRNRRTGALGLAVSPSSGACPATSDSRSLDPCHRVSPADARHARLGCPFGNLSFAAVRVPTSFEVVRTGNRRRRTGAGSTEPLTDHAPVTHRAVRLAARKSLAVRGYQVHGDDRRRSGGTAGLVDPLPEPAGDGRRRRSAGS